MAFFCVGLTASNITAVCISRNDETWHIPEIHFCCYTKGWKPFGHEKSKERLSYLADRRNEAVYEALTLFPDTAHILMIDSYYLTQRDEIIHLINEYMGLCSKQACILGASTWRTYTTYLRSKNLFYDSWTTPEAANLRWDDVRQKGGLLRVSAVGACYVFPRFVWEKVRYGAPLDLNGCEHNWLCERSGLPVFLSLNEKLWREPLIYPWLKRVRWSLHLGRFVPKSSR